MFCPKCGKSGFIALSNKEYQCELCGFLYFQNAAAAVAVIIECEDHILLTRRTQAPGKNKLDLPGGFVDPGENLEQALIREIEEELGLRLVDPKYLHSFSNRYPFGDVTYTTTDAVFWLTLERRPELSPAPEEISAVLWVAMDKLTLEDFAFDSCRQAVQLFLQKQKSQSFT